MKNVVKITFQPPEKVTSYPLKKFHVSRYSIKFTGQHVSNLTFRGAFDVLVVKDLTSKKWYYVDVPILVKYQQIKDKIFAKEASLLKLDNKK